MVGLVTAKALAMASDKPLIAINHLEGHALSPAAGRSGARISLCCCCWSRAGTARSCGSTGSGRYRRLATTIDDALGEAFDKTAKILGLGYPGGPAVERLAREGDPRAVPLPRPLLGSARAAFLVRRAQERGAARARQRARTPTPTSPPASSRRRSTA